MKLGCLFAENEYGVYAIPSITAETEALSKTLLAGAVHEPETIEYILKHRGDGVVIHAGTYIGDFLPAISGKDNHVYAFEPSKRWYRYAKLTLDMNFAEGEHYTELFNYGLGSAETIKKLLTLRTEDDGEGGASRIMQNPDGVEPFRMEDVKLVMLDAIVREKRHVSIIQLDVEGYEEEALKGATGIINQSRPMLILEAPNEQTFETDFYQERIFGEYEYTIIDRMHGNYILESKS